MRLRHALLGCGLALGLGCALTPDYARPELGLPDAWQEGAPPGESIATLDWWALYRDERLQELIRTALAQNQDLAVALSRVAEARYQVTVVRADQFPFVDVFAGAGRGQAGQSPFGNPTTNQFSISGSVTFEVDLWRKFSRATEAARNDLMATEAAYRSVTISLVATVASTYFLLRDLDERLAVAERTVEGRAKSLEIIEARFQKGTVAELDVNQAQIELAVAQAAVSTFERQMAQTRNALAVLVGGFPGEIARGETLEGQLVPPEVPPGLQAELLARRPDLVAAEQALMAETARIGVAEAMRWPSLSLSGSFGAVAQELTDVNANEVKAWNIAAGIFAPIFNSGRLKAQAQAQRARADQALLRYQRALRQAFLEVEDALVAVRTYRDEYAARDRQVTAARNAARLSRARYDGGVVAYLEVLDSERTLFTSELDLSRTRQLSLDAVVQLYKALGGGWSEGAGSQAAPAQP